MAKYDPFVRVPTALMTALFRAPLSGTQLRTLLWVIRQTYGWNRPYVHFSWYRIAREIGTNRPAVYRAGRFLLAAGILALHEKEIAIQADIGLWDTEVFSPMSRDGRQSLIPGVTVAGRQRQALPGNNAGVAGTQPKRFLPATLSRRAKDSRKDNSKTYIKTSAATVAARQRFPNGAFSAPHYHPAGAAQPIPDKYDRLSENR